MPRRHDYAAIIDADTMPPRFRCRHALMSATRRHDAGVCRFYREEVAGSAYAAAMPLLISLFADVAAVITAPLIRHAAADADFCRFDIF